MTAWWNKKYGKNAICGITHARLRPKSCIFLPCEHGFYKSALKRWTDMGKNSCPLCRRKFSIRLLEQENKS